MKPAPAVALILSVLTLTIIVARQSSGPQIAAAGDILPPFATASGCNRCAWSLRFLNAPLSQVPVDLELLPAGSSGVLHRIIQGSGGFLGNSTTMIYDGPPQAGGALLGDYVLLYESALDIRYTNGLWLRCGGAPTGVTVLYRAD